MYEKDLSSAGKDSVYVGWLDMEHTFAKGIVNKRVIFELVRRIIEDPKNQMRGFHRCDFCSRRVNRMWLLECNGKDGILGSAEVWVEGKGVTYRAPTLILHYIIHHSYRPPTEFIEALQNAIPDEVLRTELNGTFLAGEFVLEQECGRTLEKENVFTLNDTMKVLAQRHGLDLGSDEQGVEEWKKWLAENS